MLTVNPKMRPSLNKLLQHQWIARGVAQVDVQRSVKRGELPTTLEALYDGYRDVRIDHEGFSELTQHIRGLGALGKPQVDECFRR